MSTPNPDPMDLRSRVLAAFGVTEEDMEAFDNLERRIYGGETYREWKDRQERKTLKGIKAHQALLVDHMNKALEPLGLKVTFEED